MSPISAEDNQLKCVSTKSGNKLFHLIFYMLGGSELLPRKEAKDLGPDYPVASRS